MPREQVEWYAKQSLHDDDDRDHARQYCTYYSVVNVDKTNYPYSSSFEQEQTWTLTRTMSHQNKRYQTSIENIRLTVPPIITVVTPMTSKSNQIDYNKNDRIKLDRSVSLLPPLPPSRQYTSLSHRLNRVDKDSEFYQQQTLGNNNSSLKTNPFKTKSQMMTNPMRIMHINGEFVVRI
jgi:hypothetical protein